MIPARHAHALKLQPVEPAPAPVAASPAPRGRQAMVVAATLVPSSESRVTALESGGAN